MVGDGNGFITGSSVISILDVRCETNLSDSTSTPRRSYINLDLITSILARAQVGIWRDCVWKPELRALNLS